MCETTRKIAKILAPETAKDLWEHLPPELLRVIVETSSNPLYAYVQLLSLSHVIRGSIRGTLHDLSFVEPDPALSDIIMPTTDALAALVGPCKTLSKLSFPEKPLLINEHGRGIMSVDAGWADEAFEGHTQLAVIERFPSLPGPDFERILRHLPGLVELTVHSRFSMSTHLLDVLARSCSGLQVLRCSVPEVADSVHFPALAPLSGVIKRLTIQGALDSERLAALVGSLSVVNSLKLSRCPPAALEPIASHLTSLKLSGSLVEEDLPGPWLCRLEALSLKVPTSRFSPRLAGLLAANQATLRALTLELKTGALPSLFVSLCALPHLTRLGLTLFGHGCSLSALPHDLVDRLERLTVRPDPIECGHEYLASSRLQRLCLSGPVSGLTLLECPSLLELNLTGVVAPAPPVLTMLTGSPPWLRVLSSVRLTQPDLLCGGSLVRLEQIHLDVTQLPNPLVLRLPGQLQHLDLHLEREDRRVGGLEPLDLQVEAPRLIDFSLATDHYSLPFVRARLRNCPSLVHLALKSNVSLSLHVDEDEGSGMMRPWSLFVDGLEAASTLGLLVRYGAHLRKIEMRGLQAPGEDWPQLMGALSGLPRLTSLKLGIPDACSVLSLACPRLQTLSLGELRDEVGLPAADASLGHRQAPAWPAAAGSACPQPGSNFIDRVKSEKGMNKCTTTLRGQNRGTVHHNGPSFRYRLDPPSCGNNGKERRYSAKVIVLGDMGVGKTAWINRLIRPTFTDPTMCTIGPTFFVHSLVIDSQTALDLQIWDTAGMERYRAFPRIYYRGTNAALICFDLNKPASLEGALRWYEELHGAIDEAPAVLLVGCKADLPQLVTPAQIAHAQETMGGVPYFASSARCDQGIRELADFLRARMVEANP
ncbi:putative GTP-binding protein ypt5 [Paratrimastix pyriformis]|uniref:GTP-binding protein ypt5 n=1 Tax=Paratrimastix pyriformis TaxID=342808 RepID=A0ABQ8UJE0_9EUKA|nr:putative GTP-binding protein ypt5 [Paratrimastix pyriformis]